MAAKPVHQQPLALDSRAYGDAQGWRRGEHLIDALPYVDPLTPDVKLQVEKLVEEEMRSSAKRPADYLRELPALPPMRFPGHPMLQQEYERVRARQPMAPLDVSRFRLEPPSQSQRHDLSAWRAALDNANAQLEHQLNRIANLELLLKYGPNTWRADSLHGEALVKQFEAALTETRRQVDALNRERKLQQNAAGLELRKLEDEWAGAVRKNLEISMACERLEEEVEMLEEQLGGRSGAGAAVGAEGEGAQEAANGVGGEAAAGGQGNGSVPGVGDNIGNGTSGQAEAMQE